MPQLFLLFNHELTPDQEIDIRNSLKVSRVVAPDPVIKALWQQIPPDLEALSGYLTPIKDWIIKNASPGDYILIQGDFGACYLVVNFAFEHGFVPIYATTRREAQEILQPDGSLLLSHRFKHERFRKYGG